MLPTKDRRTFWVVMALVLGTLLLYWPTAGFDYINLDDPEYVVANPHINSGFSWAGVLWCFQTGYSSNWHPLTWLSHMLDCQFFGTRPGPAHLENALLHALNAALLFLFLRRLTGTFWRGAAVAAFFAWHPLRVESVAWIAERKDVLSAFFWMLALWTYARWAENPPRKIFYALTLLFYALGLMAKPMVITLPMVLLVLDWWPLRRTTIPWPRLLAEKIPFFALAAASAALTLIAQHGAMSNLDLITFQVRILNALISCASYLEKLFWPVNLGPVYPLVLHPSPLLGIAAALLMAIISVIAVWNSKKRPYFIAGWLWFVITLLPVIGLVQVGAQSMADRYTYLPSIGIFLVAVWFASEFVTAKAAAAIATILLAASAVQTRIQLQYWQDSGRLFAHALKLNPNNFLALNSEACFLRDHGQLAEAEADCRRAVQIMPHYTPAYHFLGEILEKEGKIDEEISVVRQLIEIRPDFSAARCDLARLLFLRRQYGEAQSELREGLKYDPEHPGLHFFLGRALVWQRQLQPAAEQFARYVELAPQDPVGHYNRALVLAATHQDAPAIAEYRATLELDPNVANALNNLAWLLASSSDAHLRNGPEALQLAARACALTQTNDPVVLETLANANAECGRFDEASTWAQKMRDLALAHEANDLAQKAARLQSFYARHQVYYGAE